MTVNPPRFFFLSFFLNQFYQNGILNGSYPPPLTEPTNCMHCAMLKQTKLNLSYSESSLQWINNVEMLDGPQGHRHTNTGAPGK